MATHKPASQKPSLVIRTHTLTQENTEVLAQLSQDASDLLGWAVSSSAVLRAILQYVKQQPHTWATTTLHPLIEAELAQGLVWGQRRKK